MKHAKNYTSDSRKKTVEKSAVFEKERSKFFGDSKNTVSVSDANDFERHGGGTVNGIFIAASRAETAFAAKRDKFQVAAFGAAVHGTTIRGVATMDHSVNVFHDGRTGMSSIFNFFIMVNKNFL